VGECCLFAILDWQSVNWLATYYTKLIGKWLWILGNQYISHLEANRNSSPGRTGIFSHVQDYFSNPRESNPLFISIHFGVIGGFMGKPHLSLPKIPETRTSQCSYAKTPAEPTSDNPTVKVKCSAWGSLIRTRHWASQKFRVPNTKRLMVRQLLIFKPKSQSQLGIPHNEENSY